MFSFSVSRVVRLVSAAGATAVTALSLAGAAPASAAAPGGGILTGVVNLPQFPGQATLQSSNFCGDGTFNGAVATDGVAVPTAGACSSGHSSVVVKYGYQEPCTTDISLGLASGEIDSSSGALIQNFLWNRVGLTAIILLSNSSYGGSGTVGHVIGAGDVLHTGGVGAAVFVPESVPSTTCPGGPFSAYIASIGAWSGVQ